MFNKTPKKSEILITVNNDLNLLPFSSATRYL